MGNGVQVCFALRNGCGRDRLHISRLVGHAGTTVTELVYRHQIRPVVETGAEVMDTIFRDRSDAQLDAHPAAEADSSSHVEDAEAV